MIALTVYIAGAIAAFVIFARVAEDEHEAATIGTMIALVWPAAAIMGAIYGLALLARVGRK